jgi:hypothetical protein
MDQDQALRARHDGELVEAIATPAEDAGGWALMFTTRNGDRFLYTDHTGTEKIYHSLDHATEAARGIGFESVRVEEKF